MNKTSFSKLKVQFLGCSKDPIEVVYSAFRICYSKDNAAEIWRKISNGETSKETMTQFVKEKLGIGHTSPLRQAQFIFVVDNISRACTAQFNRHHIGVEREEMSQRYVNFNKGIQGVIIPQSIRKKQHILEKWEKLQKSIIDCYTFCIEQGIKQEDARYILPMGSISREQFSMGFQALQQFLDVRLCEKAQWEIRDMGWQIFKIMKKEFPELASGLGIKCFANRNFYCDEPYEAYHACKWWGIRPHKKDISALWEKQSASGKLKQATEETQ